MVVVVPDVPITVVADVVVEPVFMVGMTAADSRSLSFSLSAFSSDQYLLVTAPITRACRSQGGFLSRESYLSPSQSFPVARRLGAQTENSK